MHGILTTRLETRGPPPGATADARAWAHRRVDAAVAAAERQPAGTLLLRSDRLGPDALADAVLAALPG